ncbi:MAG TPA: DUF4347 domain-containing protein, partial [Rhodocyclaceae bacterium]
MLFDGAAAATVEQLDTLDPLPDFQDSTQQTDTQSLAEAQQVQPGTAEVIESSLSDALLDPEASNGGHELLFIDPKVTDYQQLVDLAKPNVEVVVLDPLRDGLQQITETLEGRSDISAIHIVSHGEAGKLYLGAGSVTLTTVVARAAELGAWSASLAPGADLLLYGCDIAAGDAGRAFVDTLSAATGADVTASTDTTGNWAYGGDWNLEYATGSIEASIGLVPEVQDEWFAVLATTSFQQGVNSYAGTQDTTLWEETPDATSGANTTFDVDLDANLGFESQSILRFDNIFGAGADQIPLGAIIDDVQVVLTTNGTSNTTDTINLYRMLVDWNESTATWNTLTGGLNSGVDYLATADASLTGVGDGVAANVDAIFTGANLVATLQAWSDGATSNYGWAVLNSGTDGITFRSSETGTLTYRPELIVTWHLASGFANDDAASYSDEVLADSPINYFRLGEASAPLVDIGSSPATDIQLLGGVLLGQPGAIAGDSDTAVVFDGVDDAIVIGETSGYATGPANGTIQFWFRTDSLTSTQGLFSRDATGTA